MGNGLLIIAVSPLPSITLLSSACAQEVDYEAELILSTLMESHAGPAAAEAAAAAARGAAAGGPATNGVGVHTPGGAGVESPMADDGRHSGRSGGRSGALVGELGLSPAPGITGRRFPGATVARPGSAGAAGALMVKCGLMAADGLC